jgi:hypothetical protein
MEITMMNALDQDLVRVFTLLQQPADRIACFGGIRAKFLGMLSHQTRQSLCDDDLIWRLLQARKARKLPKLQREAK